MTAEQQNKLAMYLTVKGTCDPAQAIWSALPAFATNYTLFKGKAALIQQLAAAQAADLTGASRNKAGIQEILADSTLLVAGALTAYATVQNDQTLQARVDFTRRQFLKQRDVEMAGTAGMVHAEATSRLAALADYGLTTPLLEAFEEDIDTYSAIAEAPRTGIAGRKTITSQLAQEFSRSDILLRDILDRLILQFKAAHPAFVSDYSNARIIVDRPGGYADEEPAPATPQP